MGATAPSLIDRLSSTLSTWLGPMFGSDLRLAHDLDEVPALAPRRRMKWQQISQAGFLTLNEKRQALGYEPVDGGDMTQREQKNSEDFARLRGYPQPRDDHGRYGRGNGTEPDVDWDFVRKREGFRSEAYVLSSRDKSGVTIGIGFDIGQWSEADFDKLPLRRDKEALKEMFGPLFGKKGEEARAALGAYSRDNGGKVPSVTKEQAEDLYQAARTFIHDQVRSRYNRDLQNSRAENLPRFEDLPGEAQTAIMSLAYQYGPNLRRRTPRYWDIIVRQDWPAAIAELRDFHDGDPERREKEAERLELMLRRDR